MCVCCWKNGKDIGMTIHKSSVMSFLSHLVAFLAFHPYVFFHFKCCFFVTCILLVFGGEKTMDRCGCTATYINDSRTVQTIVETVIVFRFKGSTDNCKAIRAKIAGSRNIQH